MTTQTPPRPSPTEPGDPGDSGPTGSAGTSDRSRKRWPILAGGAIVAVAVAAVLAFGVFEVHTLFVDEEVAEAGPTFDSGAQVGEQSPAVEAPPDSTAPSPTTAAPTTAPPTTAGTGATSPPTTAPTTAPSTTAPPSTAPTVSTVGTGSFEPRDHSGGGTVNLLSDGQQTFVRFEDDFATENGPDLYAVVLVDGDRVELGELKGNQGAQNYELPGDIDPATVETVEVWCKRFDSTFVSAPVG